MACRIEYRRPVSLAESSAIIQYNLVKYKLDFDNDQYAFYPGDMAVIAAKDVIMSVTLTIDDNSVFRLDTCDKNDLNELMKLKAIDKAKRKNRKKKKS